MLTGNRNLDFIIFNKLNDVDLVNVCQTTHQANELCGDQTFWLNRILSRFPYLSLDLLKQYKQERSWSQYYIEDLRQVTSLNAQNKLETESKTGRLDVIIVAVNEGANIKANNDSVVRNACYNGHLEIVKYLVSQGADIRVDNDYAVRNACLNGHLEVVKYLIGLGADVRKYNDYAVRFACENGHLDVVKYLVSQGSDVSVCNNSAIRNACLYRHYDVVDYLVSQGLSDPRLW